MFFMCLWRQARKPSPLRGEMRHTKQDRQCAQGHPIKNWWRSWVCIQVSWLPVQGSLTAYTHWAPPWRAFCPGVVLSQISLAPLPRKHCPYPLPEKPCCPTRGKEPSLAAFAGHPSGAALSCAELSTQHGFIIQVCPARQPSAAGRRGTWRPERAWR